MAAGLSAWLMQPARVTDWAWAYNAMSQFLYDRWNSDDFATGSNDFSQAAAPLHRTRSAQGLVNLALNGIPDIQNLGTGYEYLVGSDDDDLYAGDDHHQQGAALIRAGGYDEDTTHNIINDNEFDENQMHPGGQVESRDPPPGPRPSRGGAPRPNGRSSFCHLPD